MSEPMPEYVEWQDNPPSRVTPLSAANLRQDQDATKARLDQKVSKSELVVNAKDYGAVGSGVVSDTSAIQSAVNAAAIAGGGVVFIPPGRYMITGGVVLASGVTLRGAGPGSTILQQGDSITAAVLSAKGVIATNPTSALAADAAPGATTLTLTTGTVSAGEVLLLGDASVPDPAYPDRRAGELVTAAGVSGTTVTLASAVSGAFGAAEGYAAYSATNGGGVWLVSPLRDVGIESLTIENPDPGTSAAEGIHAEAVFGLRVADLEVRGMDGPGVTLATCSAALLSGLNIHDLTDDEANGRYGYGVNVSGATTEVLVSDSLFARVRHAITTNGSSHHGVPRNISVADCRAHRTSGTSFDTHGAGSAVTMSDCVAVEAQGFGFVVRARDSVLRDCLSDRSLLDGYNVASTVASGLRVIGCIARNSGRDGLRIASSITDAIIEGFVADGAALHGVHVLASSTNVLVVDAVALNVGQSATQGYGVYIAAGSSVTVLHGSFVKNRAYTVGAYRGAVYVAAGVTGAVVTDAIGTGLRSDLPLVQNGGTGTILWQNRSLDRETPMQIPTSTTALLTNSAAAINRWGKFAGVVVFNTTTSRPVFASGASTTDPWVDATGTAIHVPI